VANSDASSTESNHDAQRFPKRVGRGWEFYVFSLPEAEQDAEKHPGWQCCTECREDWMPYLRRPTDAAINDLCRFDVARALNRLTVWRHGAHGKAGEDGYSQALGHLHATLKTLAPERLAERALVGAAEELRRALAAFRRATNEGRTTCHWRGEDWAQVESAANAGDSLDSQLAAFEAKWAFGGKGRSLQGTRKARGQPSKLLLAEIEEKLHEAGLSRGAIAKLDLDAALEDAAKNIDGGFEWFQELLTRQQAAMSERLASCLEAAERRVRDRSASLQKARQELEEALNSL
jgi:hypothetical protein